MYLPRGITLIEVILVIALVLLIAGAGLMVDFDTYRATSIRSERDVVVSLLMHARAESLNGICTRVCAGAQSHGLYFDRQANTYVLFEGSSFAARTLGTEAVFSASPIIKNTGAQEILFSALSATSSGGTITLFDSSDHHLTITVGTEGQIDWDH